MKYTLQYNLFAINRFTYVAIDFEEITQSCVVFSIKRNLITTIMFSDQGERIMFYPEDDIKEYFRVVFIIDNEHRYKEYWENKLFSIPLLVPGSNKNLLNLGIYDEENIIDVVADILGNIKEVCTDGANKIRDFRSPAFLLKTAQNTISNLFNIEYIYFDIDDIEIKNNDEYKYIDGSNLKVKIYDKEI